MKKVKAHQFKNLTSNRVTILYSGFKDYSEYGDPVPCYQFSSKEFPITGEFTGYPFSIMLNWMESLGYKLINSINISTVNEYKNGQTRC